MRFVWQLQRLAEVDKASLKAMLALSTSIGHLVQTVARELARHDLFYGHGTDNLSDEAYSLVFSALEMDFDDAEVYWDRIPKGMGIAKIVEYLGQRINERIPLPYLTGVAWFAGLPFHIDKRALIPRSPIAQLLEQAYLPWLKSSNTPEILDMGTGCGCIGIASAAYMEDAKVDIVDISAPALALARENVSMHGLQDRIEVIESDLFHALQGRQYDLIVSNPPYVPRESRLNLPAEYSHEPIMALEADDGGMVIVDKILRQSASFLKENGILIVEVGETQQTVERRYNELPLTWLEFSRGGEGVFLLDRADILKQA